MSLEDMLGNTIKDILVGDGGVDLVTKDKTLELYCIDETLSLGKWYMRVDGEPVIVNGEVLDTILVSRLLDNEVKEIKIRDNHVEALIGDYKVEINCSNKWGWVLDDTDNVSQV